MAVVGVQLSGVNESNKSEAITFIQANLLMQVDDIIRALNVPEFIFYSPIFKTIPLTGYSFTITTITFTNIMYVNVSGGQIEVPVYQDSEGTIYQRLRADEYFAKSLVNSTDIFKMLAIFVGQGQLRIVDNLGGDFSSLDFYPGDFYL